jgi:hypothetical protein
VNQIMRQELQTQMLAVQVEMEELLLFSKH